MIQNLISIIIVILIRSLFNEGRAQEYKYIPYDKIQILVQPLSKVLLIYHGALRERKNLRKEEM